MVVYKHQSFEWYLYRSTFLRFLGVSNATFAAGPDPPFYTARVRVRATPKIGPWGGCPPPTYKGAHSEIFSHFPLKGNSMSKRFRVVQAKDIPGRDKPLWLRIGTAFEKEGKMRIKLDVLPMPNKDSEVWLSLFEDDGQGAPGAAAGGFSSAGSAGAFSAPIGEAAGMPGSNDLDDDALPF